MEVEEHGWTLVPPGKKYWKALCPCADKHYKTIKLTPSGSDYVKNLAGWFRRQSCWEGREAP